MKSNLDLAKSGIEGGASRLGPLQMCGILEYYSNLKPNLENISSQAFSPHLHMWSKEFSANESKGLKQSVQASAGKQRVTFHLYQEAFACDIIGRIA